MRERETSVLGFEGSVGVFQIEKGFQGEQNTDSEAKIYIMVF